MKKYIIYKTINLITNKYYIGMHAQNNPYSFDGYFGSGQVLQKAILYYGKENFIRITLHVFDNFEDCRLKEAEIVNESFLLQDNVYNIILGGGKIPDNKSRIYAKDKLKNIRKAQMVKRGKYVWVNNGVICKMINSTLLDEYLLNGWLRGFGKSRKPFSSHSKKTKMKIANNPNIKGVICFTNGITNIKLRPDDMIPDGYKRGMVQKHDRKWITNGEINKIIKTSDEIPDGYKRGRTLKSYKNF